MNQQTVLESKRVLAILDEVLEDLTELRHIPGYITQFKSTDLQFIPPEVQLQLSEMFDYERKIEMGQGVGNEELMFAHRSSVRTVIDTLKSIGWCGEYVPETVGDEGLGRFYNIIKTLRDLMNDKFNTTVEEDLRKFEILRDTVSREQTASADVKALNREFQSERNLRKAEVAKRDQAIAKLQEELQSIQDTAVEDAREFERQIKDQETIALASYQREEDHLVNQVTQLETQLKKTEEINNKEEAALRQERRKREQFLDGLLNQYDTEMTDKTSELEQYIMDFKKDQAKLEDLEKELKIFDEEQSQRDEEERIESERKLHEAEIMLRMDTSAKLVQAFWRGFAVRLLLKKKTGKKKGKKDKSSKSKSKTKRK